MPISICRILRPQRTSIISTQKCLNVISVMPFFIIIFIIFKAILTLGVLDNELVALAAEVFLFILIYPIMFCKRDNSNQVGAQTTHPNYLLLCPFHLLTASCSSTNGNVVVSLVNRRGT